MSETGALAGLRVIDATNDSGRFATKLLTEFGADVVRIETGGSPGVRLASSDDALGATLDWWYDGGKRSAEIDLETSVGQRRFGELARHADAIVETAVPGRLAELGIDHSDLVTDNPRLVQVSITPYGRTGPRAHWKSSDLVAAAMGGVMAVTGLPDRPLNVWGRQCYNFAGFVGALSALSGVRAARVDGHGRHFDVSIHETMTGSIENIFMQLFFDEELPELPRIAERQGALHWLRAYDLAKCRTGYAMITPTPVPEHLIDLMLDKGHEAAREWKGKDVESMLERIDDLMDCIRDFVKNHDAVDLWWEAQNRHCALGGVLDVAAVAEIEQYAHRQLFAEAERADGTVSSVRMPSRMVRLSGTPVAPPRAPATASTDLDELLADWGTGSCDAETSDAQGTPESKLARPLEGLRIADFTWVLAGPFCTRMLGDLGADVIRVQNEERSTLVNRADYPYFFVWNRSKRSATLNMKHPQALEAARKLIESCDVLIENYSAGVLDSWGLDWETVHRWNPRLIYVTMSGCGHDGPWKHVISYAPTVHAVCGLTHLTNFADRGDVGPGFSLNDHLAGFSAAVSTMAALEARERSGLGQKIDMAQLEIGTYSIGPALIEHFANANAPQPAGNRDGLQDHVPNGVYPTADGFVAVSVTDDDQWPGLAALITADQTGETPEDTNRFAGLRTESDRRAHRDEIDDALGAWLQAQTSQEAVASLQSARIPSGWVQQADSLHADDEQHRSRSFWQEVAHDGFGTRPVDSFPAMIDGERLLTERGSPAYLGEHNFEVWTDIAGYEFEAVAEGIGTGLFS